MAKQHKAVSRPTFNQLLPSIGSSAWSDAHNSSARKVGAYSIGRSLGIRGLGSCEPALRLREPRTAASLSSNLTGGACRWCRVLACHQGILGCDGTLLERFRQNIFLAATQPKTWQSNGKRRCWQAQWPAVLQWCRRWKPTWRQIEARVWIDRPPWAFQESRVLGEHRARRGKANGRASSKSRNREQFLCSGKPDALGQMRFYELASEKGARSNGSRA
jgi:hypothetical protein